MKNRFFTTPKLKFLYSFIIFQIVLYTLYRILFLLFFKTEAPEGSGSSILDAIFLGMRFDIRLAMFAILPALLFVNFPVNPIVRAKVINFFYFFVFLIFNATYVLDAGYFSYLKVRVNSTAIQFLKDPLISFQMVRESYPWPLLLLLIIGSTLIVYFFFNKLVTSNLKKTRSFFEKDSMFTVIARSFIFVLLFAWGIYGSIKMYPLRWSQAFSSPNAFSSHLSLNPLLYIADTYTFRNAEYDKEKATEYYDIVAEFLNVDHPNKKELNFLRTYEGNPERAAEKLNVVVIVMESMGWFKSGIGGSEVNPTPNLDKIASESILFSNFYTPTVATARSIFAAVTSLPDLSKVKTSSRNPFFVNQHAIMGEFKGYQKYYFLGGSANWGNIRGVFSNNIPNLKIFEEGSYVSPREDVWGISDLNLFKEAAKAIDADYDTNKQPFFAFIQSSGFHRPYTIPEDSDDFKVLGPQDISEAQIKEFGFESFEEYNAMRLQDFSLGKFFEIAKKEPWYDNTIFVIFGDHSLPHNNAKNIPEWKKEKQNSYHVPFVVHSPKRLTPGVEHKIASEMDVMPTLAGLAGIPYKTRALGRDLFNPKHDAYRAAFSYSWTAPFNLSLIDEEFYYEFIPGNAHGRLIKYSESNDDIDVRERFPEKYKQMQDLANGLYETGRYLLHNNARME